MLWRVSWALAQISCRSGLGLTVSLSVTNTQIISKSYNDILKRECLCDSTNRLAFVEYLRKSWILRRVCVWLERWGTKQGHSRWFSWRSISRYEAINSFKGYLISILIDVDNQQPVAKGGQGVSIGSIDPLLSWSQETLHKNNQKRHH